MLVVINGFCLAQQRSTVSFFYDANGNRITRQIEIGGSKGDTSKSESKISASIDIFETLSVTLYPNPTEGRFCIAINNSGDGETLQAKLTTITGEIISHKTINEQTEYFDLTRYPAGIYLLELVVVNQNHIWQVIKR